MIQGSDGNCLNPRVSMVSILRRIVNPESNYLNSTIRIIVD
jgi:hypothetical protein